jgi:hypothetical protein
MTLVLWFRGRETTKGTHVVLALPWMGKQIPCSALALNTRGLFYAYPLT